MSQQCLPFRQSTSTFPVSSSVSRKRASSNDRDHDPSLEEGSPSSGRGKRRGIQAQVTTGVTSIDDLSSMDAMDYLGAVRSEAVTVPHICVMKTKKVVTVISKQCDKEKERSRHTNGSSAAALELLLSPSAQVVQASINQLPKSPSKWNNSILADFEVLRCYMAECSAAGVGRRKGNNTTSSDGSENAVVVPLPPLKDTFGWNEFCVGTLEAEGNADGYFDDITIDETEDIQNISEQENCSIDVLALEIDKRQQTDEHDSDENFEEQIEGVGIIHDNDDDNDESKDNAASWREFHLKKQCENRSTISISEDTIHPTRPDVSLLLQMDQVMTRRVLLHMITHVVDENYHITRQRALWIYALLARLEKPIHRDEASMLRRLLLHCCRVRSEINVENLEDRMRLSILQGHSTTDLACVNAIITIVSIFFEQSNENEWKNSECN